MALQPSRCNVGGGIKIILTRFDIIGHALWQDPTQHEDPCGKQKDGIDNRHEHSKPGKDTPFFQSQDISSEIDKAQKGNDQT